VQTGELDYALPPEAIAQTPAEPRDAARLLLGPGIRAGSGPAAVEHLQVRDLPGLLDAGDLVVVNSTRVLPARVVVRRSSGGHGEVLLLEDLGDGTWEALCRPSRKLRPATVLHSQGGHLELELLSDLGGGRWRLIPRAKGGQAGPRGASAVLAAISADGELPLPPYITEPLADAARYQTVYARRAASAAAPTAGLHLTETTFHDLEECGVQVAEVELVVGLDTFRPVTTPRLEDHPIHSERFEVPPTTWQAVQSARSRGSRVVAVGTTTVRALESRAGGLGSTGRTSLFITPGFRFQAVDAMMTNFHFPRSTLLAMLEAFVGPRWRELYAVALAEGYRFLSFGDAMLVAREEGIGR
jgi:S-adenosylmethionine:tRNA ribosyltransferase-isomerase